MLINNLNHARAPSTPTVGVGAYLTFKRPLFCLQVPERFIEVSDVALREFYSAIWTGRDSDPCWKKGIYKIICKLDSPVPDAFRLPGCPVG